MHINKRFLRSTAVLAGALLLGACVVKPQPSPEELQARQAHLDKVQKAKARFEELCKTAGITVNRRVTGVKGIRLEKVPPKSNWKDWADPMWAEAALSDGLGGSVFINYLLSRRIRDSETGELNGSVSSVVKEGESGFDFVDARGEDGIWRRYKNRIRADGYMDMISDPVKDSDLAPYSVSYEAVVESKDRSYWIASAEISIFDSRTNERLGIVRRYVMDVGQGDGNGGRSPWKFANGSNSCPRMRLLDPHGFFWMALNEVINVEER